MKTFNKNLLAAVLFSAQFAYSQSVAGSSSQSVSKARSTPENGVTTTTHTSGQCFAIDGVCQFEADAGAHATNGQDTAKSATHSYGEVVDTGLVANESSAQTQANDDQVVTEADSKSLSWIHEGFGGASGRANAAAAHQSNGKILTGDSSADSASVAAEDGASQSSSTAHSNTQVIDGHVVTTTGNETTPNSIGNAAAEASAQANAHGAVGNTCQDHCSPADPHYLEQVVSGPVVPTIQAYYPGEMQQVYATCDYYQRSLPEYVETQVSPQTADRVPAEFNWAVKPMDHVAFYWDPQGLSCACSWDICSQNSIVYNSVSWSLLTFKIRLVDLFVSSEVSNPLAQFDLFFTHQGRIIIFSVPIVLDPSADSCDFFQQLSTSFYSKGFFKNAVGRSLSLGSYMDLNINLESVIAKISVTELYVMKNQSMQFGDAVVEKIFVCTSPITINFFQALFLMFSH